MKIYQRWEETQVVERTKIERVSCDWCGVDVEIERGYDTREFCLEFTKGSSYGNDGGQKTGWEVEDLCNSCVVKLRKLLEESGVHTNQISLDW